MQFTSEKTSDKFVEINHCDVVDMKSRNCLTLRENGRVDYYVMYVLKGRIELIEDGKSQDAVSGDLILYRPRERQEYRFFGQDQSIYAYVHFSGTACEEILSGLGFTERLTHIGESSQLERLLREATNENYLRKPHWNITAASLLLQFFTEAARKIAADNTPWTPALDRVIQHMHLHFEQNRPVAFYAEMCHLSESRFAHLFKQVTGMSPKQYLLKIKVDAACRLLSSTTLSITDVALAVGIEDLNYFGRLFKKQTGKTPSQFR